MKVILQGVDIAHYSIKISPDCSQAVNYAAIELQKYIKEITGYSLLVSDHSSEYNLILSKENKEDVYFDGYTISFEGNDLMFQAKNDRGVLYAVYAFLEYLGYRFFTQAASYRGIEFGDYLKAEEFLFDSTDKKLDEDFKLAANPVIYYRDAYTFAATEETQYPKFRLNAETWNRCVLPPKLGGALRFAGESGHSFNRLVPTKMYYKEHPEYYALRNGVRADNPTGGELDEPQLCLTNEELPSVVLERVLEMLPKYPNGSIVSISQNDNGLFCECEKCKESFEKYGKFGTIIRFINKVAKPLKKLYPNLYVHTYAYEDTSDVLKDVEIEDNVIVQLCPRICHNHSLYDKTCAVNCHVGGLIKDYGKKVKNLFIYDYRSCLQYSLLFFPDILYMRDNMRFYAENNVKGIYSEHNIFAQQQPVMEELRTYLFCKLAFNPYMSQEEFDRHINEFLQGFYGVGWKYLREYLEYWQEVCSKTHLDSFYGETVDDELRIVSDENEQHVGALLFDKALVTEVAKKCNELLDKAKELATSNQAIRIEIVRTSVIWYKLFHTMDEILENGTEEEKKVIIEENRDLCARMRRHQMKYTTYICMNATTDMYHDFSLSPSKWNYAYKLATGKYNYGGIFNLQSKK